jgi:Fe-S-cluster-containing dehydrogenase component
MENKFMNGYQIEIDVKKCCGCYACFLSCRDEFDGKERINIRELEHGEGDKVKVDYIPEFYPNCELCSQMMQVGETETRCTECCPTGALRLVSLGDGKDDDAPVFKYLNAPEVFVAGELVYSDKYGEPATGVTVILKAKSGEEFSTVSNFLGDFEFSGVYCGEQYNLLVCADGYEILKQVFTVNASKNLGSLILMKGN